MSADTLVVVHIVSAEQWNDLGMVTFIAVMATIYIRLVFGRSK